MELKACDNTMIHGLLQRDQQMLVEAAGTFDWVDWKGIFAYWLNAANPDGTLTDPTDPAYGMTVRTRANGDVTVSILMDPITGEAFLTMHEAEVEKLSRAEREHPNSVPVSLRSKNLTALMKLLIRGWRRADGTEPTPLINIVMSQHVAEDLLARTFGHTAPPKGWDVSASRAETLLASAASGEISSSDTMFGSSTNTSETLSLEFRPAGPKSPLVSEANGTDHVHPHSKHGPTNLTNGTIRCRPDNQAKGNQADGWRNEDGSS